MVSARKRIAIAFTALSTVLVLIILLDALLEHLPGGIAELYTTYRRVFQAIATIVAGVIFIQLLASASVAWLRGLKEAYLVRNVVLLFGYITLAIIVSAVLGVSGESIAG